MSKALIVFATRSGQTERIAELIAEGLRMTGMEVELKNASAVKDPADLNGYDAYLFGSATYHGEMMPSMKQLLFIAEKADLEGKCGGSFGSYGWSGEAVKIVTEELKAMHFEVVEPGLKLQYVPTEEGVRACYDLGKKVADRLKEITD